MQPEVLKKYEQPVPRYTSYPTAPHFEPVVTSERYRDWLGALDAGTSISLYAHIPFCDRLCWYCGCNTKATERYQPVAAYLQTLQREMTAVAAAVPGRLRATHIHWGGGSPSILSPEDVLALMAGIRRNFIVTPDAEIAVEMDPRHANLGKVRAFAEAGFNRVSIGVQDFNEAVQAAINRHQSFGETAATVAACRAVGIASINVDLVYGLPKQTRDSIEQTVERVIDLQPDRVAMFGYAHLPSRLVHQRLIPTESLPGTIERFAQANRAANKLLAAGYVRVGLDHFARPTDALATGRVQRNFQGYTTDTCTTLLGFGASAIGRLPQGYVQNAVPTAEYTRRVEAAGLAVARDRVLTDDDRARGYVIEALLCDLEFSARDVAERFDAAGAELAEIGQAVIESDEDGLVEAVGTDGSFRVTEKGRLFLRSICACFDAYLGASQATHAAGV